MTVLTAITLASGLVLTPAPVAGHSATPTYQRAAQTLDRMTAAAQERLRSHAVDRALSEGLVTFNDELARRMADHARVAANRLSVAAPRVAH